jgi:protein-L-isoaspartate(D-aspartate) O-methyltransferase
VPVPLVEQLADGGRLVIPVGDAEQQDLLRITKRADAVNKESLFVCRFVPLLGCHGWPASPQETVPGIPRE